MSKFLSNIAENATFVLEFVGIVAAVILIAVIAEKVIHRHDEVKEPMFTTRKVAMIGMFSAIAAIIMYLEIPLPFLAPTFYKLDFSELPVLICGFAFGPVAGVVTEFIKIVIKLFIKPTSTAFVGELANFCVGCSFVLPATIVYHAKKTKKMAIAGSVTGTLVMTVFGTMFNAIYLLPAFAKLYGNMPIEDLVAMGTAVNPAVNNVTTFVILCVAPLNLIKGSAVSLLTYWLYKPLSPILKASGPVSVRKNEVRVKASK